jgi:hypothetical protein
MLFPGYRASAAFVLCLAVPPGAAAGGLMPQSDPASTPTPEVRLEVHDGKTAFYLGEPIQLDLVFRNTTGARLTLNGSVYGDLTEKVEITPSTGWIQWRGQSGHDYASIIPLGASEVRIPVILSQGFVFRQAGQYRVRVTTNRVSAGEGLQSRLTGPVTTNAVDLKLTEMPAGAESALVLSLIEQIKASGDSSREAQKARTAAISRLSTLQGDDALRAKVDLILAADDTMRSFMREALASTRNLELQLSLLKAGWSDSNREPAYDLPEALEETRTLLRGQSIPGWVMAAGPPKDEKAAKATLDEHIADMEILIHSLPQRAGDTRATAAYYILEDHRLPAADLAMARPIALEEFAHMDDIEQHMLLETAWPAIRDPSLTTPLRAMLDKSATDRDALKRLIELDPVSAKPYVVNAVCDAKEVVTLDSVGALPDATLPEVDGCLGALLRESPSMANRSDWEWKSRALLAARFASPAILPDVRKGWAKPEQDPPVIALLLRYAPAEAVKKIQSSPMNAINPFFDVNNVFKARQVGFPDELTSWLRQLVKSGPNDDAGLAAFELSRGGAPEDLALVEDRLVRVHAEWAAKLDQSAQGSAGSPAESARKLAHELMSDLRDATVWSVSDAELEQLAQNCLSDQCRLYSKHPQN